MPFAFKKNRVLSALNLQAALDEVGAAVNNVSFMEKAGISYVLKQRQRGVVLIRRQMQNMGVEWRQERIIVPPEIGAADVFYTALWSPVGPVGVNQGAQTDGMSKAPESGAHGHVTGLKWTFQAGAYSSGQITIPASCHRKYIDHTPVAPPTVAAGGAILLTLDGATMTLGGEYYNSGADVRNYTHICRPVWDVWLRARQVP